MLREYRAIRMQGGQETTGRPLALIRARLGNATASLNLSVSPTRLRRYCCAVRRDARHTVRGQPRRKALRSYRFAVR